MSETKDIEKEANWKKWKDYLTCIIFHMSFPLLPLMIELLVNGTISPVNLLLATSMYCVTIGLSSVHTPVFALGLLACIIFAVGYGLGMKAEEDIGNFIGLAYASIGLIFVIHLVERFARHISGDEVYFILNKSE